EMEALMDVIKSVRNIRAEMDVAPSQKAKLILVVDESDKHIFERGKLYFEKLAYASQVVIQEDEEGIPASAASAVTAKAQIFIPLEELIDFEKEMERLNKEKQTLEKELARAEGKLSNENFVKKAPAAIVEEERKKKAKYQDMMNKVLERIEALKKMMEK
ncbi:MAG: valine--tRNA ligase, partial [Tissierellales bacterium]